MLSQSVKVGRDIITVQSETFEELLNSVSQLKEMNARLTSDTVLTIRTNANGVFIEGWSKEIGAKKRVSAFQKGKERSSEIPYYVGLTSPWVTWNEEEDLNEVMFEFINDELESLGFTESGEWYFAKKVEKTFGKGKDAKKRWVWEVVE